ncbi:transcription factor bHLH51-like protein [Cinnamomum micranthum f. kanehirae]|uniref:Transcription factor bHLH51-like protein n=1 Tax=Cinnamomum micranthum f. kanehirae TaxID=337451 RepID=A0A443NK10_9MAGN|nr:transcription factor bHLH51-like protein [Cinnamomum micranthum f. kanehirae]
MAVSEDAKLKKLVDQHGPRNWSLISSCIPGRSGKSCRLRWCNQLSPAVEHPPPFQPKKMRPSSPAHAAHGNMWPPSPAFSPARTDNAIKNHWNSTLRRRLRPQPRINLTKAETWFQSKKEKKSQAEKRRRERINTHLSTLRRLVPSATKLDKATLLGRVIDHVKELKRKALEIGNSFTVPTETDDVTVECDRNGALKDRFIIRASLCCDDRPELYTDLIQALHGLKLRTVRADMATLGGE